MTHIQSRPAQFDIHALTNEHLRRRYLTLARRFADSARSAEKGYGLGGLPIDLRFICNDRFNAYCSIRNGRYEVDFTTAIPVLTMLFFDELLSSPEILTWLPGDALGDVRYDVLFSGDPHKLDELRDWSIRTNPVRAYVAYIASEIASTFVLLHELGHIICGHLQARDHLDGKPFIAEFSYTGDATANDFQLHQLFEYEADAVASSLITRFVDELVEEAAEDGRAHEAFGFDAHAAERSVAFCAIVLYALFAYLKGLKSRLQLHSSHPEPLVRAFYTRDMIWQVTARKHRLDDDVLGEMLDELFDQTNDALVRLGLQIEGQFQQEGYFDEIARGVDLLKASKVHLGPLTRRFSFVPWD